MARGGRHPDPVPPRADVDRRDRRSDREDRGRRERIRLPAHLPAVHQLGVRAHRDRAARRLLLLRHHMYDLLRIVAGSGQRSRHESEREQRHVFASTKCAPQVDGSVRSRSLHRTSGSGLRGQSAQQRSDWNRWLWNAQQRSDWIRWLFELAARTASPPLRRTQPPRSPSGSTPTARPSPRPSRRTTPSARSTSRPTTPAPGVATRSTPRSRCSTRPARAGPTLRGRDR